MGVTTGTGSSYGHRLRPPKRHTPGGGPLRSVGERVARPHETSHPRYARPVSPLPSGFPVEPGAILRCFADLAERGAASVAPVPALGDGDFESPDEAARPTRYATAGHPVLDSVAAHRGEPVGRGREAARGGARLGLVR